jgi:hypothetical protein
MMNWPELTNRLHGTHKGAEREHYAAFLSASGTARSRFNPSWFADAYFDGEQT